MGLTLSDTALVEDVFLSTSLMVTIPSSPPTNLCVPENVYHQEPSLPPDLIGRHRLRQSYTCANHLFLNAELNSCPAGTPDRTRDSLPQDP